MPAWLLKSAGPARNQGLRLMVTELKTAGLGGHTDSRLYWRGRLDSSGLYMTVGVPELQMAVGVPQQMNR